MVSPTAVRQWAEKGELNALTTPGGHRRFLPAEVKRFAHTRGMSIEIDRPEKLRVLVVDDDEQYSNYLCEYLTNNIKKITVETASDGFIAGLKVMEFQPEIILLDLMMPGVNGFEVCSLLKAGEDTQSIRIIAMSGFPSQENINNILKSGAEDCLAKPVDTKVLCGLLRESRKSLDKTSRRL